MSGKSDYEKAQQDFKKAQDSYAFLKSQNAKNSTSRKIVQNIPKPIPKNKPEPNKLVRDGPYIIVSKLSFEVSLYLKNLDQEHFIGSVLPGTENEFTETSDGYELKDGNTILVYYYDRSTHDYEPFGNPFVLRDDSKLNVLENSQTEDVFVMRKGPYVIVSKLPFEATLFLRTDSGSFKIGIISPMREIKITETLNHIKLKDGDTISVSYYNKLSNHCIEYGLPFTLRDDTKLTVLEENSTPVPQTKSYAQGRAIYD